MLTPKDEWERKIFADFSRAVGLRADPGSVNSGEPPEPDIRLSVNGVVRWFELVEITDERVARRQADAIRTKAARGGAFSQFEPLQSAIESKSAKVYQTGGARLDLLAYYDRQYPPVSVEPDLIPNTIRPVAEAMIASGGWSKIWVFNTWEKDVLWMYPEEREDAG